MIASIWSMAAVLNGFRSVCIKYRIEWPSGEMKAAATFLSWSTFSPPSRSRYSDGIVSALTLSPVAYDNNSGGI
ncbi:Uncharacterised protein [Mycobacterium tuberculosis]|nr:Uncharacterised protein [Mycobacterium tuberculosis]